MSKHSKQFKLKVIKEFLKSGDLKRTLHEKGVLINRGWIAETVGQD